MKGFFLPFSSLERCGSPYHGTYNKYIFFHDSILLAIQYNPIRTLKLYILPDFRNKMRYLFTIYQGFSQILLPIYTLFPAAPARMPPFSCNTSTHPAPLNPLSRGETSPLKPLITNKKQAPEPPRPKEGSGVCYAQAKPPKNQKHPPKAKKHDFTKQ